MIEHENYSGLYLRVARSDPSNTSYDRAHGAIVVQKYAKFATGINLPSRLDLNVGFATETLCLTPLP